MKISALIDTTKRNTKKIMDLFKQAGEYSKKNEMLFDLLVERFSDVIRPLLEEDLKRHFVIWNIDDKVENYEFKSSKGSLNGIDIDSITFSFVYKSGKKISQFDTLYYVLSTTELFKQLPDLDLNNIDNVLDFTINDNRINWRIKQDNELFMNEL